jgi:hypothetical protein
VTVDRSAVRLLYRSFGRFAGRPECLVDQMKAELEVSAEIVLEEVALLLNDDQMGLSVQGRCCHHGQLLLLEAQVLASLRPTVPWSCHGSNERVEMRLVA